MAVLSKFYRLPLLLGGLCCVAAAALAVQWYFSSEHEQEIRRQLKKPVASKIVLADPPEDSLQLEAQDKFKEIIERPMFLKSRKPLPTVTAADTDVIETPVQQQTTELSARFTGYIEVPEGKIALIKDTKTRKYHRLHKGEQINEWTLTELHPDRVVFQQGNTSEELLLRQPKVRPGPPGTGRPHQVTRPASAPRSQPKPSASARRQQLMKRIDRGKRTQAPGPDNAFTW